MENKKMSSIKLEPETIEKLNEIAKARYKKDQVRRTNPSMVAQLANEAYENEIVNK